MSPAVATFMFIGALAGHDPAQFPTTRSDAPHVTTWLAAAPKVHALRGVVKSVSATTLVVVRPGRTAHDITFVLTPAILAEALAVGATVSVRYRVDGAALVAIAVTPRAAPRLRPTARPPAATRD